MKDTIQPVGELMANSNDEAITLSGTGDTQEIRWAVTLPVNYSYVITGISANIELAAANTWEDLQNLMWIDTNATSPPFGQSFEWGIGLESKGVARFPGTAQQVQVYHPIKLPTFQMLGGGTLQATFVDLTTEEPAANFNCTARFLMYTIGQQFDAAINTPQLIR